MAYNNYSSTTFEPLHKAAQHMVGTDVFEPQRTNNFEIRFPNLNQLTSSQTMSKDNKVVYNDCGKAITLSVASVGDLSQSISAIPVSYGNNAVKFAGKPELNSISITINDFIGLETERILESWSALVYNKYDQTVGKASKYKQRAYLIEYSPDYEIAKVWQLEGCWPGDISYGGYQQDNNSIRQITMTLNVDFAFALDGIQNSIDMNYQNK